MKFIQQSNCCYCFLFYMNGQFFKVNVLQVVLDLVQVIAIPVVWFFNASLDELGQLKQQKSKKV